MANISAKIKEAFRNLRSDAVPRPPRDIDTLDASNNDVNVENLTHNDNDEPIVEEEINIEPEDFKQHVKPRYKLFFRSNKKNTNFPKPQNNKKSNNNPAQNVNTQATGNVVNIIGSSNVRWGSEFVYYLGPNNDLNKMSKDSEEQEVIEKNNFIALLMEASILPGHEYIDYISKNLGKNWHSFFRRLGYTKGRIETFEIDESRNGVSEARYKLLLDWIRNEEDGTLGCLASHLWEEGERHIVKDISLIYAKTNNLIA